MTHVESQPWTDPIVAEVRAAREAIAAHHGYDIDPIAAAMNEPSLAAGRKPAALQPSGTNGHHEPAEHESNDNR